MSEGNPYWFPDARQLRRLEAWIKSTQPRPGEALEYAAALKAPVKKMAEIVADIRAGLR